MDKYKNIVVLTGAGISVASGLKTYRGIGSEVKTLDITKLASKDRLQDNPLSIWQVFNFLRQDCLTAKPNKSHYLLATIEKLLEAKQNFTLITQNVDRLHHKAGSKNIIELHGRIDRTCCFNPDCKLPAFVDNLVYERECPLCPQCSSSLKPNVVLFGKQIPLNAEWQAKKALINCDLFMAIGTSGTVFPAANYVRSAEYVGARTILVNLEKMNPKNPYF